MKLNYRALITCFILITVIFCLSSVEAVGRVTQGWKIVREGATEPDLLFRTYSTPHSSTLKEYTNLKSQYLLDESKQGKDAWKYLTDKGNEDYSKWIYNEVVDIPGPLKFGTVRMVFHKQPLSDYPEKESASWGYNDLEKMITYDFNTIQNVIKTSKGILTTPNKKTLPSDNEIYAVDKIKGTYYNVSNTGTGLFLKNINAGKLTEYRYALIQIDESSTKRNIYLEDSIVYSEDLKKLVDKLDGATECYVTDELLTETYQNSGKYEVAKTAHDFIKVRKQWSYEAKGTKRN